MKQAVVIPIGRDWFEVDRRKPDARTFAKFVNVEMQEALRGLPRFMSPKQAGEALGFGATAIREWVRQKRLRAVRVGGKIRIYRDHLAQFLTEQAD